jgi:hypothetical protein
VVMLVESPPVRQRRFRVRSWWSCSPFAPIVSCLGRVLLFGLVVAPSVR